MQRPCYRRRVLRANRKKESKNKQKHDRCLSLKIFSVLFTDIHSHSGAKPPPEGLIKAKFTYFLHFFSFLDQTCQIDYDCWPNDIKFLFDSKC